jgi:hypothetical protein
MSDQGRQQASHDYRPAMGREFDHVFAGVRVWSAKDGDEDFVDGRAVRGIMSVSMVDGVACHRFNCSAGCRPE